jgi:hypothetical protein
MTTVGPVSSRSAVYHGEFQRVLAGVPDGSVRAIITDPPYPRDALPLWTDLGRLAARVLDPTHGVMLALSGKIYLPEIFGRLGESLEYRTLIAQNQPGPQNRVWITRTLEQWKPWLVFQRPGATVNPITAWLYDSVTSRGQEKDLYEWQQSPAPAAELIRQLVPEGEIVLDPFMGVGTYGVAAVRAGARFIGAELDDIRFEISRRRIDDAHHEPEIPGFRAAFVADAAKQANLEYDE